MGETAIISSGETIHEPTESIQSSAGDSDSKATENRGTGNTRRRRRGTGGSIAGGTEKSQKSAKLADVARPDAVEIHLPNTEEPVKKPRKPRAKKSDQAIGQNEIELLIAGISGVASSRKGCEMWELAPDEISMIAKPLTNILAKSELFNKIAEHSDAVALTIACATVFAPRAIMQMQIIKERKRQRAKTGGLKIVNKAEQNDRNNGEIQREPSSDVKAVGEAIFGNPTM